MFANVYSNTYVVKQYETYSRRHITDVEMYLKSSLPTLVNEHKLKNKRNAENLILNDVIAGGKQTNSCLLCVCIR